MPLDMQLVATPAERRNLASSPRPPVDSIALQGAVADAFTRAPPAATCRHCGPSAFSAVPSTAPVPTAPLGAIPYGRVGAPIPPGGAPAAPPPAPPPGLGTVQAGSTGVVNLADAFDGHPVEDVAFFQGLVDEAAPGKALLAVRIDTATTPTRASLLYGDIAFNRRGISGGIGDVFVVVLEERNTSLTGRCPLPFEVSSTPCFAGYRILGSARGTRVAYMDGRDTDPSPSVTLAELQGSFETQDMSDIEESAASSSNPNLDTAEFFYFGLQWHLEFALPSAWPLTAATVPPPDASTGSLSFVAGYWLSLIEEAFALRCSGGIGHLYLSEWQAEVSGHGLTVDVSENTDLGWVGLGACEAFEDLTRGIWGKMLAAADAVTSTAAPPTQLTALDLYYLIGEAVYLGSFYDQLVIEERCPCP